MPPRAPRSRRWRPPGRLHKPKQYRDEQEPLRTATLAEDRNLYVWPWQSEAQCLQKLAADTAPTSN